jgi:hypothetical protein
MTVFIWAVVTYVNVQIVANELFYGIPLEVNTQHCPDVWRGSEGLRLPAHGYCVALFSTVRTVPVGKTAPAPPQLRMEQTELQSGCSARLCYSRCTVVLQSRNHTKQPLNVVVT